MADPREDMSLSTNEEGADPVQSPVAAEEDPYQEAMPFGDVEGETATDSDGDGDSGTSSGGREPQVGDAPEPMSRGRSEDPPPDGVGYDGSPVDQIQRDRAERLAAENRPENSEVDNSGRVFDVEKAMFTDEPGYDEAPKKFPPAEEQGA